MSVSALPDGWRREEIKRTNGLSCKTEVIYVSPDGLKIKSKKELAKYLENVVDLSTFDYRSGKINPSLLRKHKKSGHGSHDHRAIINHDPSMSNPVRQTVSFFKHPVTIVKNSDSKVLNHPQIREYRRKHNLPYNEAIKSDPSLEQRPFQRFWPKRLEGQRASNRALERLDDFQLPPNIRAFSLSLAKNENIFRSINASLYFDNRPIRGQERKLLNKIKKEMDDDHALKNLLMLINPHQPLSYSISISETDITQQEGIVRAYREKLKEAIENKKTK